MALSEAAKSPSVEAINLRSFVMVVRLQVTGDRVQEHGRDEGPAELATALPQLVAVVEKQTRHPEGSSAEWRETRRDLAVLFFRLHHLRNGLSGGVHDSVADEEDHDAVAEATICVGFADDSVYEVTCCGANPLNVN